MKKFDKKELKLCDGSDPKRPIYFAYKGKVYDMTSSPLFAEGVHFEHFAGCDLTDFIHESPHGEEVFEGKIIVGEYEE